MNFKIYIYIGQVFNWPSKNSGWDNLNHREEMLLPIVFCGEAKPSVIYMAE